ncbi:Clp protease [Dactylosporangium vinaceum]|uniref:Clp protease N-terminal domain-containing protein n=1 Tax=Dactylosporangium vinaceum TaxID=53362 RepID=A0ABV5LYW0_9ACTN|nr:Clp protease N-terminal domain-containing protein [Dactylosporangium vinaceum]UAB95265.1 Clp protease [Dactylosporangium vinaceum]
MFERFTKAARTVVQVAKTEAEELGHTQFGTEHLILAILRTDGALLERAGVRYDEYRAAVAAGDDAAALRSIGIDIDAVRASVEQTFGPGALERAEPAERGGFLFRRSKLPTRLNNGGKKALELSLRVAIMLHDKYIGTQHLLLGVLKEERSTGPRLLRERGVTYDSVLAELKKAA